MTARKLRNRLRPLLLLMSAAAMATAMAGDRPTPFIAVYDVHHSGARVGESTVMLTRINRDAYSLSSTTHPRGFASLLRKTPVIEHSRFEFTQYNQMHGMDYEFDDGSTSGKRNRSITFDWNAGVATSVYQEETHTIVLDQDVGDRLAMQALLMRDLGEDVLRESYRLLDRDAIKTYHFTALGEELLDTPAGRFNTVKLKQQREGSTRSYHIWLAREHDFAIVKMTQFKNEKPRTVLTATRIQSGVADNLNYGSSPPEGINDAIPSDDGPSNNEPTEHADNASTPETPDNDAPDKVIDVSKSGPVLPAPEEDPDS